MYIQPSLGPKVAEQIMSNADFNLISGDGYLAKGIEKMKKQTSKNISLNNCVYFAVVDQLLIDQVFSFDKHWRKNGYSLLIS